MLVKSSLVLVAVVLSGCAGGAESSFDPSKQDGVWDELPIEVGEQLSNLSIRPLRVPAESASPAQLRESVLLLRLRLEAGQSTVILMRADDAQLDSHLIIKDTIKGATLSRSDDQIFIATGRELDSGVSITATQDSEYLIFAAGGRNMQTGGSFTIDAIAISDPHVDLSVTSPGLVVLGKELRSLEDEVGPYVLAGIVVEQDDGYLGRGDLNSVALRDRNKVLAAIDRTNRFRQELYTMMIAIGGDEQAEVDLLASALAPLHQATR